MARRPSPFTPPDCDLRGLPFMPLHGDRLVDSNLFFETSGDEFKAAVALWWASWKQLPAASLPNNEKVLAGLARIQDASRWATLRNGALHGWVLCSDGRLYHRVVADLALEAWEERQEHRAGREAEKERKRLEREERKALFADLKAVGVVLPWNTPMTQLRERHTDACPQPVRRTGPDASTDCPPPVTAIEGTGTGTGTKDKNPQKPPEGAFSPEFEKAWSAYPIEGRATSSKSESAAAWKAPAVEVGEGRLLAAVLAFAESPAVIGPKAKSPPKFHVWLRSRRYEAFLESAATVTKLHWDGSPEVLAALSRHPRGEPWALGWLRSFRERPAPERALVTSSQTAFDRLTAEGATYLADLGIAIVLENAA